ncbi:MAG TPA: hypothetical protein VFE05_21785 [Longimicrobiaceae bacterium]|jgi:hypothetical protein|nr:hypothetical protein [Longimicrobiaceae bacterium]
MKKLKLTVEALEVESFDTGREGGHGTVHGLGYTQVPALCEDQFEDSINYCTPVPTAGATCGYTCGNTCSCGCTNTQAAWTCNYAASECTEPYVGP